MDMAERALELKHGPPEAWGWTRAMHEAAGYRSPDAEYEGAALSLIPAGTRWLDLGCGRAPFPHNPRLCALLSARAGLLVGVDASANVLDNPYLHQQVRSPIETFAAAEVFDVVTLRMVAEHLAQPVPVAQALARLVRPGGTVLIYTVHRWSPTAMLGAAFPHRLHRLAMRRLFGGEDRDVFPAHYRMNTRRALDTVMAGAGFEPGGTRLLDDCRTTQRWRVLHRLELLAWSMLRRIGVPYPERCILAIFIRRAEPAAG